MSLSRYLKQFALQPSSLSLRLLLTLPFVVQVAGVVGTVGYLSYRHGQQTIETMAYALMDQVGQRVTQELDHYLQGAHRFNQSQVAAIAAQAIDPQDLDHLHRYLILQHRQEDDLTTLLFGTPQGDFRISHHVTPADYGVNTRLQPGEIPFEATISEVANPSTNHLYGVDGAGQMGRYLETIENMDVRDRPWYRQAVVTGQPGWVGPYQLGSTNLLTLNAQAPVYDEGGDLLGVVAANITLNQLGDFLANLEVGQSGEVIILERNGLVVATSTGEGPYALTSAPNANSRTPPGTLGFERLQLTDLASPTLQRAYESLSQSFSNLDNLQSPQAIHVKGRGPHYFITVVPYSDAYGLDWLVMTVIPDADFTAAIQQNLRKTVGLCLLALGGAISSGVLLSTWVTRQITRLTQASAALAAGDLTQQVPTTSPIVETKTLALAFNQMAVQLRQLFQHQVAAEATRQSEARFQRLAAAVPGMIYTYTQHPDGSHGFEYVSAFSQTILELSPAEVLADIDAVLDQIHPDDRAAHDAAVAHSALTLEPFTLAFRNITPSGHLKWLEVSSQALCHDNGSITWYGILLDVSQRAEAEAEQHRMGEQLRRTEQWLHQYSQQSPSTIYTIVRNPDGYVWLEYISAAVETMHEITLAQALDNASLILDQIYPEDRADYETAMARSAKYLELFCHEWRSIMPSGQLKWLRANSQPELRSNGAIAWHGVVQDISDRKRGELALQQALQALNHHIEMSPLATIRWNQDCRVEYWSTQAEKIFGWTAAEVIGKTMYDWQFIFEDDVAYTHQVMAQLFQGTRAVCANRNYHKDGSILYCEWYNSILLDDQGKLVSIMSIAQDITDRKQAEAALKRSEERWQLAIQGAKDGIWDHNLITNEHFLSPHCLEMLGYSAGEIDTFDQWVELVHPQDRSILQSTLQQYLNREIPQYAAEYRMRCRDGSYLWILSRGQAIWNEQGTAVRMIGSITDISERHQAEAALRQSEARYLSILDEQTELITRFRADGTLLFVNDAFCRYYDLTKEQVIGQQYHPRIYEPDQPLIDQMLANLSSEHPRGTVEHRVIVKGEVRWMQWINQAIYDDPGNLVELQSVGRDIHNRKQAELALQESEARFWRLSNASPANIYILVMHPDGSMQFEHISQSIEAIHGLRVADILADAALLLNGIHPDDAAGYNAAVQRSSDTLAVFEHEWRIITPTGAIKWLQGRSQPQRRENGDLVWYGVVIDISDRKAAEAALQQANQQLEAHLGDLRQRNQDMVLLGNMHDCLQVCLTPDAAYAALPDLLQPLFPNCAGGLFTIDTPGGQVKAQATWGQPLRSEAEFGLADCWALRRGSGYWVPADQAEGHCQHVTLESGAVTLCIPMLAQGEISGLLYLSAANPAALPTAKRQLAHTVAEQMALAIANLHLRETLREQSIRDPLTGLFNRRYLEESLQQEIIRAQRYHHSIGVIMIDIDHFKQFNDTYGHDTGDYVLKTIGQLIQDYVRRSDIACRYGGEELTLLLPGTTLEEAALRAEALRAQISHLALNHNHQNLGTLTASFGVACFPNHGPDGAAVMQAADQALYQAKAAGRDRVICAPPEPA